VKQDSLREDFLKTTVMLPMSDNSKQSNRNYNQAYICPEADLDVGAWN